MQALCERFGISRETGYVWLRRYRRSEGRRDWWIGTGLRCAIQPDRGRDRSSGAGPAPGV